jgi:hypothetical protein
MEEVRGSSPLSSTDVMSRDTVRWSPSNLRTAEYDRLRAGIIAATGLKPKLFDPLLSPYSGPQALRPLGDTPPPSSASPSSASPASSSRFRAVSRETDRRQKAATEIG